MFALLLVLAPEWRKLMGLRDKLPQYEVAHQAEGTWWALAGTLGILAGQGLVAVGVSAEISVTVATLVTGSTRWVGGLLSPS